MAKAVTIKLDEQFYAALKHFKRHDPRHMNMTRQVKLALMCYWTNQRSAAGLTAYDLATRDDWDPKDFLVKEDEDAEQTGN